MAAHLFPSRRAAIVLCLTLLLSLALASASPVILAAAPVPAPAPAPVTAPVTAPAPAPKLQTLHEKVVGSLRAAGHYGAISGLLDSLPDSIIKDGITLFAPNDNAFSNVIMNSTTYLQTLLSYHVATKVYSYQALSQLPVGTKIQSSAPNVFIVVTSTAAGGYKLDDSLLVDKDIYTDSTVSVQGIDSVLNTAAYNKGVVAPEAAPAPATAGSPPSPTSSSADGAPSTSPTTSPSTANPNTASVTQTSLLCSAMMILSMGLMLLFQ